MRKETQFTNTRRRRERALRNTSGRRGKVRIYVASPGAFADMQEVNKTIFSIFVKRIYMTHEKALLNGKSGKKVRKKVASKKPVPGSVEAFEESLKIIKKNNLDFSYLKA